MKQETIKDAAEKYINDDLDLYESLVDGHISYNVGIDLLNKLFKEGAKWQQERSYSEEEVIKILYQFHYDLVNSNFDTKEEWFEQFSKLKNG